MKKLPNGISNYESLVEQGYYYVDKTKYIEKIENLTNKTIMFLRPRKFGKTLFTSVLENYYDVLKVDKFEKLFGQTYIGKNPTSNKNKYYILKFNFSGIDTSSEQSTMNGFKNTVANSIQDFVNKYNIEFNINMQQAPEDMLNSIYTAFSYQKPEKKIYVIIDEYDHFANELLGFHTEDFKNLLSKNGKVRKWYEILKKGTESVVDRIFITGVAPITLDSLTSGFNISKDITRDERFNEMFGFTEEEVIELMESQDISKQEQETLLPIMKENYDGYKFSLYGEKQLYNSNMCLYLLSDYVGIGRIPDNLIDVNIASDYSKLSHMLNTCKGDERVEIIKKTISGEGITSPITEKFNPEIGFKDQEMISMLFYLGYLTIKGEEFGEPKLKIPNKVMRELYSEYFLESIEKELQFRTPQSDYSQMAREMALEGKVDKIIEISKYYLSNLSNRDYERFDEKYVKILFYSIAMNLKNLYWIKSEAEVERSYPDLLLTPRDKTRGYHSIMIEFKYLKKSEAKLLKEKQKEAKEQIEKYSKYEEIQDIENLHKYTIIAVVDEIYVEVI
ncbi:MAG TPA: hypothetical protein DEP51_03965 [Clostridiales bacterium]|nr:hypothetical protein [Clostridiales bacterium]